MIRIPLRPIRYRGRNIRVPSVKLKIVRGRKVLVPLKKGEPPSLSVMPYWNRRIDFNNKTVTLKKSTFRIPVRGLKKRRLIKKPKYTIQPIIPVRQSITSRGAVRRKPVVGVKTPPIKPTIEPFIKPKVSAMKTRNQQRFIAWTKKTFPKLYHAALLDIKSKKGLGGIGDFFGDLIGSLKDLAPSYLQFKQQKDLMKMQLKRAQQGLPPADVKDYAPVIKTQIDLAPATRTAVIGGMKDMIMPIAIGGGVLLLVLALKKR